MKIIHLTGGLDDQTPESVISWHAEAKRRLSSYFRFIDPEETPVEVLRANMDDLISIAGLVIVCNDAPSVNAIAEWVLAEDLGIPVFEFGSTVPLWTTAKQFFTGRYRRFNELSQLCDYLVAHRENPTEHGTASWSNLREVEE